MISKQIKMKQKQRRESIMVALSGGVDSAVTALLLQRQGFRVVGVHFVLPKAFDVTQGVDKEAEKIKKQTQALAKKLGIKLKVLDCRKAFSKKVITYLLKEYQAGKTPNVCVFCNANFKFSELLAVAKKAGIKKIATGHYARKVKLKLSETDTAWFIKQGRDKLKDQSYFLSALKSSVIERLEFPLGELTKEEVKKMARIAGLFRGKIEESRGICFLRGTLGDFVSEEIKGKAGKVVDVWGNVLGEHQGLAKYTLGQREGVGVGGHGPYFVVAKDYQKRELVVSNVGDEPKLFRDKLVIKTMGFLTPRRRDLLKKWIKKEKEILKMRVRYFQPLVKVKNLSFSKGDSRVRVTLDSKVRAVTPGQIAVFYNQKGVLVLAGEIESNN